VRIIIVGGSASRVGKTALACALVRREQRPCTAMKVSVTERDVVTRISVERGAENERHGDTGRLLDAGANAVVWVTVSRRRVRDGLAAGLLRARALRPQVVVVESTSAGIHLRRFESSWFVAGSGPWKPWAGEHRDRATYVVTSSALISAAS
jgi:predicted amidohydrolase